MATKKQKEDIAKGLLIPCMCDECPKEKDIGIICTANKTIFTSKQWYCYKGQRSLKEAKERRIAVNKVTERNIIEKRILHHDESRPLTQEEISIIPNLWEGRNRSRWTEENEKNFQLQLARGTNIS